MPRPPTKHGLERKFKPWRRGMSKSTAKKPKSSLKNQLRGKERLLAKLSTQDEDYDKRRAELQASIAQLKEEIGVNHEKGRQRKNAVDSHGTRFLERQRLTRMERSIRTLWEKASEQNGDKERYEKELQLLALDQVYVAHFPHDAKYLPLFRKGVRITDTKKATYKRSAVRRRILLKLAKGEVTTVKWITSDQYKRVPKEWSVEMEISAFGAGGTNDGETEGANSALDDRFAITEQQSALLEAAEKLDAALEEQRAEHDEQVQKSQSESDEPTPREESHDEVDSESDINEADPLRQLQSLEKPPDDRPSSNESRGAEDSDDSSSSSSSSSQSSDSSSDESSDDEEEAQRVPMRNSKTTAHDSIEQQQQEDEQQDDFLVPVAEDSNESYNAFEVATKHAPAWDHSKGDKSQGWASQRQRPDQRRKRQRTRR